MPTDGFYPKDQLPQFLSRLSEIKDHAGDFIWVEDNLSKVAQTLEAVIQDSALYFPLVDVLMALLATALIYAVSEPWLKGLTDIVLDHPVDPLNPFQNALLGALRQFQPLAGVFGDRETLPASQTDALLQAYTTLTKTLVFGHGLLINEELLEQANKLANDKFHERIYSEYYQALSLYYAHRGDLFLGERMGQMAYNQYESNEDAPGSADAACTLAIIYRSKGDLKTAKFYLDRVLKRAQPQQLKSKLFATMIYEQGSTAFKAKLYEEALDYYRKALETFEEFEALYQIAMTHQAIAQCYCKLRWLDQIDPEIKAARTIWQQIDNRYEQATLQMLDGEVELLRGNKTLALNLLNRALKLARELADSPARDALILRMNEFINEHYPPYTPPNPYSLFSLS